MNPHVNSTEHICAELNSWDTYASSPTHNDAVSLDVTTSVSVKQSNSVITKPDQQPFFIRYCIGAP